MKALKISLAFLLFIALFSACSGQPEEQQKQTVISENDQIEVMYFHYTRRCATCNAVESVSKAAVAEYYGENVAFTDFNLDEENGKNKAEELGVSGQALLIVAGNNKMNITNEGFMHARNNPEKLKTTIKEKIDPLLN